MKNKLYNALFSELNPYFYIKVKDGRSETGNKESYYGKIPRDDRCTFDISNNKVLVHMGESGKIKAANFYRDCYPADDIPGVWMHKDFSSVAVSYEIFINGQKQEIDKNTEYTMDLVDNIFPRTLLYFGNVKVSIILYAPISENGDTRSNAFVYGMCIENTGPDPVNGEIRIIGETDAEDDFLKNEISILQGSGRETTEFSLPAAEHIWIPSVIYAPGRYEEAEKIRNNSSYWFEQTHNYFRNMLGRLVVEDHPVEGALFERAVMQCFHAIAMNASGEVTGSNWGSFPATRQIWMKDMYYAFLPFCILEPDLAWKGMEWFINYGIRPEGYKCRGGVTHSLGNSLAGILLAGITFENTGKAEILKNRPEIFQKLVDIMDQVERTEDDNDCLYPCTWISDALALGKYHTGSNICVWKAFQSMAEICGEVFHDVKKYSHYTQKAEQLKMAIDEEMTVTVGGKRQYLEGIGGTGNSQKMWIWEENYRKPFLDTALVFLQDVVEDGKINLLMHDGEESDTTLMPFYGYCDYFDDLYRNFMNFTVTENPTYDAEIKGIRWGAMSGATFPGFISALSVAENEEEFRGKEGRLTELLRLADVDGSWWWWPYGVESHRGEVSRSNGCGKCAWASGVFAVMYITQFLGIKHDGIRKETEVSPMKFQGKFKWENSPFERDTMIGGTNNV